VRHSRNYDRFHHLVRSCPEYIRLADLMVQRAIDVPITSAYDHPQTKDGLGCDENSSYVYSLAQPVRPDQQSIARRRQ
jgi:hypothetical protein